MTKYGSANAELRSARPLPPAQSAAMLFAALALLSVTSGDVSAQAPLSDLIFTVTTDYSVSGQCASVGVLPPWDVETGLASVHSDAIAREHEGLVYIVNRLYADNIQVLDPSDGFSTVRQFSVGPGTNPVDIAFVDATRAYVSRYETPWLLEVDATTGAVTDSIDLSVFADGDGLPEPAAMAVVGGRLFVSIQRIDRDLYWTPVAPSWLAVIDTSTNALVDVDPGTPGMQGVELTATNPYTDLLLGDDGTTLYIGESGTWSALDGGIEAVDTATLTTLGLVITESELGGNVEDFALPLDGRAHAVVSRTSPAESYCVAFDWDGGSLLETVWRPGGWSVPDVEVHPGSGQLFVADRTYAAPGVRVFDAATGVQLGGLLDVGLPPHDLLVLGDVVTGVAGDEPGSPGEGGRARLTAAPNPSRGTVWLSLTGVERDLSSGASVRIHDVAGRFVREIRTDDLGAANWDGCDERGRAVASGVYFARAAVQSGRPRGTCVGAASGPAARIVLLR